MGAKDSTAVTRHIRALFGAGAAGGASDGQLLERFRARGGDPDAEAAFGVLVARHGPMVLGVCRRALRDPDAAADAFQATFLVLVRKAGSVRVEDSLGRWLYGVSRRVAARARVEAARRASREGPGPGPEPAVPSDDGGRRELLEALDEEVARLPEPFRAAVLLCDLEGMTHEAAAGQLGCPVGTVESRLSRGRKRLRERLTRRGLAPSVAVSGAITPPSPAVPEALSVSTVEIAARGASVSVSVSTLIEGVVVDMFRIKLKTYALGLVGAAVACGLGGLAAGRLKADGQPEGRAARPVVAPEKPPEAAALRLQPPARVQPGDFLQVEVLEALPGRPISGERIVRPDGTITLGFYGDLMVAGLNRDEIKVKVIERMLKYLPDEVLGLEVYDPTTDKMIKSPPVDSDRVFVDDSLNYTSKRSAPTAVVEGPTKIKPGDNLLIEVLEALPGRPITGERLVRPDGTVSLGFYGDIPVAGLTRQEVKVKVIEHLCKSIDEEKLGLTRVDPKTGKRVEIAPADSDRVFVDDSGNLHAAALAKRRGGGEEEKLDRILKAVEALNPPGSPYPRKAPEATRMAIQERRLANIEAKLDRLIRGMKAPAGKD